MGKGGQRGVGEREEEDAGEKAFVFTPQPRVGVEVGRQHCILAAYVSSALPWKSNLTE